MTVYCTCPDVTKTVTPDLKRPGRSRLLYVDLGGGKARTGGTCLAQVFKQIGDTSPDMESFASLVAAFDATQSLLDRRLLLAGHDRSDGGLVTTLLEMAFAGNCGFDVDIPALPASAAGSVCPLETLFAEEAGFVVEVAVEKAAEVVAAYAAAGVMAADIGVTTTATGVRIRVGGASALDDDMRRLRDAWEATSFELEKRQCNVDCVTAEIMSLRERTGPTYTFTVPPTKTAAAVMAAADKPKVCVLRQEGSNGDREMLAAFHAAGFEAWDVNMNDLLAGAMTLERFQGVVFVGGFSYADVLDSAKGWAGTIKFNAQVLKQFEAFKARPDTFSLGVCNGCQLMALLGWVPRAAGMDEKSQPRFVHNESGRFESRWSTVRVEKSPAVMLQGMEGSVLGVWVAHGEGRVYFPDAAVAKHVEDAGLVPLRYVDDAGAATEAYPFNPNGSPGGITALCSEDGRHLAMMPHPERCFQPWQWAYLPDGMAETLEAGPWLTMFQNARVWCESHRS
ncbi:unnamed protein product [Phaeothamnion confervicola]